MSRSKRARGIGFCGMLTILFIGLKLTHHIDWSWLWVLAPLWAGPGFAVALFGLLLGASVVVVIVAAVWAVFVKFLAWCFE